ncbi:MAG: zinc-binding dehydrogenase [Roseiflexaceae bacterium]
MKKVVVAGTRQAALVDASDLTPVGNWVVVKVHAAPLCAEYKSFVGGAQNGLMGHEAAGEVVAVAQSGRFKLGDRVVAMPLYGCGSCALCLSGDYIHCQQPPDFAATTGQTEGRSTMAQYILKQDWLLMPIPDGLSYERGALACCGLGPSFGAMQTIGVSSFDTILITGLGPVGLGAIVNARFRGARVIAVESVPWRVERARAMGVAAVLDPRDEGALARIMELTGGRGTDCALDCSGNVLAERMCVDATRRKGKIAFVGECYDDLKLRISPDMLRKGLTLIGSWHYNLNDYPKIVQVIQESPLIDQLVSHIIPMSEIQAAFELSASHETAKIILHPWE